MSKYDLATAEVMRHPYQRVYPVRGHDYIVPFLAALRDAGVRCFIAGGFARFVLSPNETTPIADDVDVYFNDEESYHLALDVLLRRNRFTLNLETQNAMTLSPPDDTGLWSPIQVQLIKPISTRVGNVYDVLDKFDLNVCQAAIMIGDADDTILGYASEHFLKGETHQKLRVMDCSSPLAVLQRCCKYAGKGYKIATKELLKVLIHWDEQTVEHKTKIKELIANRQLNQAYDLLDQ